MDKITTESLRGFEIKFQTKPGVFSPGGLDNGSKLLIDSMEITDGTLVADLGSGTGVIGFVAAKLNPTGHVHLLDDHLRAYELARENVLLNDLENVEVYLSDLFSAVPERTYHTILSNPPQSLGNEFLEEIARECVRHLKDSGTVYWVVKNHLKPYIKKLFEEVFKNAEIVAQGKEHFVIKGEK